MDDEGDELAKESERELFSRSPFSTRDYIDIDFYCYPQLQYFLSAVQKTSLCYIPKNFDRVL